VILKGDWNHLLRRGCNAAAQTGLEQTNTFRPFTMASLRTKLDLQTAVGTGFPRQSAMARTGHLQKPSGALREVPAANPNPNLPISADEAIQVLVKHLSLTSRQAEVLHWVAEGKSNEEISIILECSFFTVKNHLREVFRRLDVHGRVAAAACAYRAHIVEANGHASRHNTKAKADGEPCVHTPDARPAGRRSTARKTSVVVNGQPRRRKAPGAAGDL
jgi:DNA-binding CsgD family transcriptional regulator